jgi:hypothetical protein
MSQQQLKQLIRANRTHFRFAVLCGAALAWCGVVDANGQTIVRVEEDWELVVATPDQNSNSPQVTCAISPFGHTDSVHAIFDLNHNSQPEFVPGGLQLQTWNDESPIESHFFSNGGVLSQADETVTWTQTMTLGDNEVTFAVEQGNSSTWGQFGGDGQLECTVSLTLSNLNDYSADVSVQNSGVGFASNRVHSLVLKRVRLVTSTGEVVEDNTPRVVHSQN